jgi:hypothetical protein
VDRGQTPQPRGGHRVDTALTSGPASQRRALEAAVTFASVSRHCGIRAIDDKHSAGDDVLIVSETDAIAKIKEALGRGSLGSHLRPRSASAEISGDDVVHELGLTGFQRRPALAVSDEGGESAGRERFFQFREIGAT